MFKYTKFITALLVFLLIAGSFVAPGVIPVDAVTNTQIRSVVLVVCSDASDNVFFGSGTIIRSDGVILTNKHVVEDASGPCTIGVVSSSSDDPQFLYTANVISMGANYDIALLGINETVSNLPYISFFDYYTDFPEYPELGDRVEMLGFPGIGGLTITYTSGYVSGLQKIEIPGVTVPYYYIKTDATIEQGNSGGAAFFQDGTFMGIPTQASIGTINSLGFILPALFVRDYIDINFGSISGIPHTPTSTLPTNPITDSTPPDNPSSAIAYTDSTKTTTLDFNASNTDSTPYIEWEIPFDNIGGSGVAGYYVYFGQDIAVDPRASGKFQTTNGYLVPAITSNGTYYLLITTVDVAGNAAAVVYFDYIFQKPVSTTDITPPTSPQYCEAYTDATKITGLDITVTNADNTPYVEWTGATDDTGDSGLAGYYVAFGQDATVDPLTTGRYQTANGYAVPNLTMDGEYYVSIITADKAGNLADTVYCTYQYQSPVPTLNILEGAMIRAYGDFDIWIVKYVGSKKFKRLILSPSVFNSYGHLRWEDVMDVDQSVVDSFATSELVRAVGDDRVYKLYPAGDTGEKRWITTAAAYVANGWDWDAIYEINQVDRDSYIEGQTIQ